MLAAAFWGFFAAGSLLLGAALALWRPWSTRAIGLVMAFGTGVLFSSVECRRSRPSPATP